MTFKLEINCDNDAFGDRPIDARFEVANLLRQIALKIDTGSMEGKISDYNGNTVGQYAFKGKQPK